MIDLAILIQRQHIPADDMRRNHIRHQCFLRLVPEVPPLPLVQRWRHYRNEYRPITTLPGYGNRSMHAV